MARKAILLLSGGLDSATVGAIAKAQGFAIHALTMDYGQRHQAELLAAARVAKFLGVAAHKTAHLDLRLFGGSALTGDLPVPKARSEAEIGLGVPTTYVPARNTIFLSYALAYAEVEEATDLFIGVNAVDYSGYPDCRPEFIAAFARVANLATAMTADQGRALTIHVPLIHLSKAEIIRLGIQHGLDYSLTVSCYDPNGEGMACGACDACQLRRKGFLEAGIADPTRYQSP